MYFGELSLNFALLLLYQVRDDSSYLGWQTMLFIVCADIIVSIKV